MLDEVRRFLGAAEGARPKAGWAGFGGGWAIAGTSIGVGPDRRFGGNDVARKLCQSTGVLLAGRSQPGITSNLAEQIVFALAVPGEKERAREGVQIHDKMDHLEGQVTADVVDWRGSKVRRTGSER